MSQGVESAELSVHPSVVFKLGADLITDDMQALVELIKNSFDADASRVDVRIDTQTWSTVDGAYVAPDEAERVETRRATLTTRIAELRKQLSRKDIDDRTRSECRAEMAKATKELASLPVYLAGQLTITDDGSGMTRDQLIRGWLTVSASEKQELKRRGWISPTHSRTPLGDKGLGRLGAQRLGRILEVDTRAAASPGWACQIDWNAFASAHALRDVPIAISTTGDARRVGTTIRIRGLSSTHIWTDTKRLQASLVEVLSPWEERTSDFQLKIVINDDPIDLYAISSKVLEGSVVRYVLDYREGVLTISGAMSTGFLRAESRGANNEDWDRLIKPDAGASFSDYLLNAKKALVDIGVRQGGEKGFLQFHSTVKLEHEVGVEYIVNSDGDKVVADPGPFTARLDAIQRLRAQAELGDAYTEWIEAAIGVRIYRDGFGVRTKENWLDLASQWTKGSSWYTLRPGNVVGYLALSANKNAALEETTGREGFSDLPAFRNLTRLIAALIRVSDRFQSGVRRTFREFAAANQALPASVPAEASPQLIAEDLRRVIDAATLSPNEVAGWNRTRESAAAAVRKMQETTSTYEKELFADSRTTEAYRDAARELEVALARIREQEQRVIAAAAELAERRTSAEVLVRRLEDLRDQVENGWDLMALGITAEVVAHEVKNLGDRLVARSRAAAKYNDTELQNRYLGQFIEHVLSTSQSLIKQVSRLDLSLRYMRDRRRNVDVGQLISDMLEAYRPRGLAKNIDYLLGQDIPIHVLTSEGRLSQALDNLLLNSEYWVSEALRTGAIDRGKITIDVDSPYVTVSDNGPGIHPTVEPLIWEPFITQKPAGQGRGLGLFVTRQLLLGEHITPTLDPDRNTLGNRYRFRLDFSVLLGGNE